MEPYEGPAQFIPGLSGLPNARLARQGEEPGAFEYWRNGPNGGRYIQSALTNPTEAGQPDPGPALPQPTQPTIPNPALPVPKPGGGQGPWMPSIFDFGGFNPFDMGAGMGWMDRTGGGAMPRPRMRGYQRPQPLPGGAQMVSDGASQMMPDGAPQPLPEQPAVMADQQQPSATFGNLDVYNNPAAQMMQMMQRQPSYGRSSYGFSPFGMTGGGGSPFGGMPPSFWSALPRPTPV